MAPPIVPQVDVHEAHRRLAGSAGPAGDGSTALLVDVRETHEFVDVRAEGAVLVPLSRFVAEHDRLPKDKPLLMICHSGARSHNAAAFLLQRGWTDVSNVSGGTVAWAMAGLPVRRGTPGPDEGRVGG